MGTEECKKRRKVDVTTSNKEMGTEVCSGGRKVDVTESNTMETGTGECKRRVRFPVTTGNKETGTEMYSGGREAAAMESNTMETGTGECNGGWNVDATASNKQLENKWNGMCGMWSWLEMKEDIWPNVVVCEGNRVVSTLEGCARIPEWVIVDGGGLHCTTTKRMTRERLQLWGVHKSVSVWTTRLDYNYSPSKHHSLETLASKVEIEMQKRAARAFYAVGGRRFKEGTKETDFRLDKIQGTIATTPAEIWGGSVK